VIAAYLASNAFQHAPENGVFGKLSTATLQLGNLPKTRLFRQFTKLLPELIVAHQERRRLEILPLERSLSAAAISHQRSQDRLMQPDWVG
jgi:hypothetical protein